MTDWAEERQAPISFDGDWRSYLPIALTNLALTIVTLGIYRAWATTRSRQYLCARTRFFGERLEWIGTARELLVANILVALLLIMLVFGNQLVIEAVDGERSAAGGALAAMTAPAFLLLYGLARFRAIRYRLSRIMWRGITGGSREAGWTYAALYAFGLTVAALTLWLIVPLVLPALWRRRWEAMQYGDWAVSVEAHHRSLWRWWLPLYSLFLLIPLGPILFVTSSGNSVGAHLPLIVLVLFSIMALFVVPPLFFARYIRAMLERMEWNNVRFGFNARTRDWVWLYLRMLLLVVGTLGIGSVMLEFMRWRFIVEHLELEGAPDLLHLGPSGLRDPRTGEGLLDALDIGAF